MGKTVNYHPVSLNVLRGALAYGGFTVDKFKQHNSSPELGYATYETEVKAWPEDLDQVGPQLLKGRMNACFASDVNVVAAWITRTGKRMCRIQTHAAPMVQLPLVRYEDLSDEEKADIPF